MHAFLVTSCPFGGSYSSRRGAQPDVARVGFNEFNTKLVVILVPAQHLFCLTEPQKGHKVTDLTRVFSLSKSTESYFHIQQFKNKATHVRTFPKTRQRIEERISITVTLAKSSTWVCKIFSACTMDLQIFKTAHGWHYQVSSL